MNKFLILLSLLTLPAFGESLRLATFRADVTPQVGAPLCGGLVKPVAGVSEPLLALGVVILSDDKPVVLCAVDWCEIRAGDHVHWREVCSVTWKRPVGRGAPFSPCLAFTSQAQRAICSAAA